MLAEEDKSPEEKRQELPIVERLESFRNLVSECRACQKDVEPHWQYCAHCGVRQATQCPGCGNPLPPAGAASCPHCGLRIPQTDA